jgi:DNA-binding winged helix-turn-helix (wHTH) protein/serine/threonine protein kinase/tetratricopeptide (TPR) repeat protein
VDSPRPPDPGDSPGHIWRFADCELDERRRELRVRGSPVDIEVKPLEVLHQLLLHAGEVVTKAELLETVWTDLTVVDGSLATAVSKLRKILGDTDTIIVTVPRVGYKLAVPVQCRSVPRAATPDLQLAAGQPVPGRDQWRLARRLDLSPSSEVWLAEHPRTRESRVFKFASDAVHLRGLKREVTVARLIRESLGERPEFVRVLEWNFTTNPYFVESEFGGPNLAEWSDSQGGAGCVPIDLRLKLLADVARAVAAAHGLDLLHKDLKPGNILMASSPGATPQIKVADFGSASLLGPERLGALGITNMGFTLGGAGGENALTGTLMYVAPEVLAGQAPTAASDVYALGVLLYQLAIGDFRRPLAPGWEADIPDPVLRADIAEAACGDPARRLPTASALVDRLDSLDRRRAEHDALEQRRRERDAAEVRRAHRRARRPWLTLAVLTTLVAVAAGVVLYRNAGSGIPNARTVAVLPLQNMRSDPDLDFLRLALADEITTALTHSHGLLVRPFSAASQYDGSAVDLQRAARDLRADSIVTGQFTKSGEHLLVALEAVDIERNQVTWRDSFESPAGSLIAAQVQIALRVRGGLAPALGAAGMDTSVEPRNEEAFELYLRSAALPQVPAHNRQALEMLERAVKLDPGYPPAWLALGRRYYTESRYGTGNPTMMSRYDAAMERALALDPNYVPAGAGLIVSRVERGDLVGAHRSAADLVRRRPDSVDAQFVLSYVLRYAGLLAEAAERCEAAFVLDRRMQTSGLRTCAMVFLLRGDYPRTMNYLRVDQGSDFARALTIDMLARQGKPREALSIGSPNLPEWKSYDLLLACLAQEPPSEIAVLAGSVRPFDDPELNYFAAAHLAYCGHTEAAVDLLTRAIKGNYCAYPSVESDPLFATVRAAPQYGEIHAAGRACQEAFLAGREQR